MCHQLKFDLGQSSTRYLSVLHKKSICGRGSVQVGQLMFSREKLSQFAVHMRYATIFAERICHTAWLPKKGVLPARNMPANIKLKEMCV